MDLNIEQLECLGKLMAEYELTEVKIDEQTGQMRIRRGCKTVSAPVVASAPAAAPAPVEIAASPVAPELSAETCVVSPIVGTFYSSPEPNAPMFVKVGDTVSEDTVVCIVEAMKVMNEIKAERSGIVKSVLVENGTPVEFDQPLFEIS